MPVPGCRIGHIRIIALVALGLAEHVPRGLSITPGKSLLRGLDPSHKSGAQARRAYVADIQQSTPPISTICHNSSHIRGTIHWTQVLVSHAAFRDRAASTTSINE